MQPPIEFVYPTVEDVFDLYAEIIEISRTSVDDYVLNRSLLESALNRPKTSAYYANADLVDQAATFLWGMVNNHAFNDGNKRIAYGITLSFLRANGWTLQATEDDEFVLMIGIGKHLRLEEVSDWIRRRINPYS